MKTEDLILEKGLPADPEVERLILGSVILNGEQFDDVAAVLHPEDFSLDNHRLVFQAMSEIREKGGTVDRMILGRRLIEKGQLAKLGGFTFLVGLDEGLPKIQSIEAYAHIVKDLSKRRRLISQSTLMIDRCMDPAAEKKELQSVSEEILMTLGEDRGASHPETPGEIVARMPHGPDSFLNREVQAGGLATGFKKFDEMTGGLHSGELILVAARPSVGKTALVLNMAQFITLNLEKPVAVFSLEMSKESLLSRLTCAAARVDSQRFRLGYLDADERRRLMTALTTITEAPLYLDDAASATVTDLHAKVRKLNMKTPLALVIIDYLQLMTGRGKYESQQVEVSNISRGLKLMAKELNIPIVACCQLSRAPELRKGGDFRPQLSDLRGSGSLEQDADMVAFIYREEMHKKDRDDLKGKAEIILAKNRNGPTGTARMVFIHALTKFENYVMDLQDPLSEGWQKDD